ncbi:MAG: undecaprenyldiphospho-muramoylpentapeptide beta-N-acetylglucosaminyltransferase [Bacteroidales bacterium]|nr:undecaprenyldiphospho-muramoylpentapeptide beta-N-acetylglucosaminyltransferase [Bacteroidales bacterium]
MSKRYQHTGIVITGGGTGGHIFPALSIAHALKAIDPDIRILFIGAKGKMEMERVPEAGYNIVALPISGMEGRYSLKNLLLPFKLLVSIIKARTILKAFQPSVVVGVGGYASAPALFTAAMMRIKTVIQEQNAFPGKTNRWLAKNAALICVANDGMEQFFPGKKIVVTGNPVRKNVIDIIGKREEAMAYFGLHTERKTILVIGGSQGALSINKLLLSKVHELTREGLQLIWQTGQHLSEEIKEWNSKTDNKAVSIHPFIHRMDLAYAAADLIVSRAGAIAIAEATATGIPAIYVPFPFAADDHQTKNAETMRDIGAAIVIRDSEINNQLIPTIVNMINDKHLLTTMHKNALKNAKDNADMSIAHEIANLTKTV